MASRRKLNSRSLKSRKEKGIETKGGGKEKGYENKHLKKSASKVKERELWKRKIGC